jgi:Flp pilus assembly protein TadB
LRGIFLKAEKKESMQKMRAYKKVRGQNKKLNKIYLVALAAGLLLTVLDMKEIGGYIIWTAIFVFILTGVFSILASGSLRRQR